MTEAKRKFRASLPVALVIGMGLLGYGTISNQFKINATSTQLTKQAMNGQRALNRQCRLLPVSKKLYADALDRHVITAADFDAIVSTGAQYCPQK